MTKFIDDHRSDYGVEPICKTLPIAPSTYYARVAERNDLSKLSARAQRGVILKSEIERVFKDNRKVYGVRKVWHQMRREGYNVARCTVARLTRELGIRGVVWGKSQQTTFSNKADVCPRDLVNRQFKAERRIRSLFWMHWSRLCTSDNQYTNPGLSTTVIGAVSMSRLDIRSGLRKLALSHRLVVLVIVTIMLWPRQ